MRGLRSALLVLLAGLVPALALAQMGGGSGAEFSATAVQTDSSGKEMMTFKMYVGADGMRRTETTQNGQRMVQIMVPTQGTLLMIFPDQKAYMERRGAPAPAVDTSSDPCAGQPNLTCKLLGEEAVDGRPAKKWEIVSHHEGQTATGIQWIDAERGTPLRQQRPDGTLLELKMVGQENLQGRNVEKWEMTINPPSGQGDPVKTLQWYDPALKVFVRQELAGGGVSELRDIQVGPQPKELFQVPAGYQLVQPPQQQQAPQR